MNETTAEGGIARRLESLGITLPRPAAPAGAYVAYYRLAQGNLLYVSGQLPIWNGELRIRGRIGQDLTIAEGQEAARLCGLNLIAQAQAACGALERVKGVVRLTGFVNAVADFVEHPQVLNGASELMTHVFGDAGRHTRVAVGAGSLPLGAAVEVEGIFELNA